ncbi:pentapeptide repeat-containing protein [Bradyrhizobium sp. KB893862 SZCCT0404]|uniref:pentapeptide repeat-containing protein n=1 Tax=Bradyrhizobium sp. KB893862 SZCCT0404 TaxID=2807672 RepID=UPI001BAC3199|nr:pentapeptide repeat-containing protein [Bradyrhizobium sp. KB893862 SZCCT0404]MBR1177116.1 pentapeptide repeat-containing protein [Bradyrhizobium sp. KB893862 SZCCT0404]
MITFSLRGLANIVVALILLGLTAPQSSAQQNKISIRDVYGHELYSSSSATSIKQALEEAVAAKVNLSNAKLDGQDLEEANLRFASLSGADLAFANLHGANLDSADLRATRLEHTNLQLTLLLQANLSQAICYQCNLTDANLGRTNLDQFVFEPAQLPPSEQIARVVYLDRVRFVGNPSALFKLKSDLRSNGFITAGKSIIAAINRSIDGAAIREHPSLDGVRIATSIRRFFFDLTSGYGSNLGRPFSILGAILIASSIYYWLVLRFASRLSANAIFINRSRPPKRALAKYDPWAISSVARLPIQYPRTASVSLSRLRSELRLAYLALLFSFFSAVRIGFREINLGTWIGYLQRREFAFYATGWPRMVAGFQSLSSIYLIAIAVLSFFTKPFDV